ncbi:MAG: autoinducer binding domain-containing protein [Sphingobium sp.]|nr:autoinducer binding domain-containing protein [Sphingobium sp.]
MLAGRTLEVECEEPSEPAGTYVAADLRRKDYDIRSKLPTINSCSSTSELRAWLLQFARGLGFYGARYIHVGTRWWRLEQTEVPVRFLTTSTRSENENKDWLAHDPCVSKVQNAFAPFVWSTRPSDWHNPKQMLWLEQERARGISAGIAVPVQDSTGGPAYLSFFGNNEPALAELVEAQAPELAFVAAQFHAIAKSMLEPADWTPTLDKRDIEVLKWAGLGKTYSESAAEMGVSARTVEHHLRKVSDKLGVKSKVRAVVIAFGLGLTEL